MSAHSRSYRVFCLASILSLLLNVISPLSTAWKPLPALAAASALAPASTGENTKLDSASSSPNALQPQIAAHPEDAAQQPAQDPAAAVAAAVRNAPIMFIENVGQSDRQEKFRVQGAGATIRLADNGLWFTFLSRPPRSSVSSDRYHNGQPADRELPRQGVHLRMSFVGANQQPRVEPFDRLNTRVSYYLGNELSKWHANVPVWGGVRLKDLYPGIDLELASENGQFVMRMVVQSGADMKTVRLHLDGADALSLKGRSQISIATAIGERGLPLVQVLQANRTRLSTAGMQPQILGTDIVQPFAADGLSGASATASALGSEGSALLYSTYFGGNNYDKGEDISVDASGAAYIVGTTSSTDLPTQAGAFTSNSGYEDAFVTKFNSSGSDLVFSTYLGGTNDDVATGIATDATGAAYVTGATASTNFPSQVPTQPNYGGGSSDAFVAKFGPTGSLLFSTYLGGSGADASARYIYGEHGNTIAVDADGSFYVAGTTQSTNFPTTTGPGFAGGQDAFVAKFNAGLSQAYSTLTGGSGYDAGHAIAVDANGAAYITGEFSGDFPTQVGGRVYGNAAGGIFIAKLNTDGSALQYATFLGGNNTSRGQSITVDPGGAAYVAGYTFSTDFPTTEGAYDRTCGTDGNCNNIPGTNFADAVVVKLSSDGSLGWSTYLGGSLAEGGNDRITLDRNGFVYISGSTDSDNFPTKLAFDSTCGTTELPCFRYWNADVFLTKMKADGSDLLYSTFLGGSDNDWGYGVAVDANGAAYLTGRTWSTDFPTRSAYQAACSDCDDAFVTKLSIPLTLLDSQVFNTCCPKDSKAGDSRVGATSAVVGSNGAIFNQGDPINTRTGGVDYTTVDLSFPALGGQMVFQRSYSSLATDLYTSTLGYGWTHNQDTRLILPGGGAQGGGSGLLTPSKTSANTATAGGGTPILFIENVGQFDDGSRFQVRGAQGTMFLARNAIWLTALEHAPSAGQSGAMDPNAPGPKDDKNTPRKGVGLKESFPGAKAQPKLEPFDRLKTHVSYFAGKDPKKWHADVPVWGGVRYKDLYPGIDLEVTSEQGQLLQRLVARSGANLDAVHLRLEGADSLAVEAGRVKAATSVGSLSLPLLRAVAPDGSPAKRSQTAPAVKGNEVTAPFAPSTPSPRTALATTAGEGALELLYSTFLGGSGNDAGRAIAVDQTGQAYIAGNTNSSDMPVVPGSFDTSYAYAAEVYVAKLNTVGSGLVFATFLGEGSNNNGYGIALDNSGNVYVTGETSDPNFPISPPDVVQPVRGGSSDAFVTKLSPTGTLLMYSTFLGGSGSDYGYGIAVNGSGEAFVTGRTYSSNFPVREGAWSGFLRGSTDAFVAKLNSSGSGLIYSTYLGGNYDEWGFGIALDASGNAFVTGETSSTVFWTAGAFDTSLGGANDAFVTKLNPTGSALVYSTYLGGSSGDTGRGIAVDGSGAAYVTGDTGSSDFPKWNAFDTTFGGSIEGFVTKVNATGSTLDYSTFVGGSGNDYGYGIAVNGSGEAVVTGLTNSTDFPWVPSAYDTSLNGNYDAFVTELNATGNGAIYSTYVGGAAIDQGFGAAVDGSGAIYVVGWTVSTDWPTTPGAFQTTCHSCSPNNYYDIVVLKLGVRPSPPAAPGQILFKPHNANQLIFNINTDGTYSPYPGVLASLVATTAPPGYRLTASDQSVYVFDTAGRLLAWADAQAHTWSYDYDGQGRLARVRDATGQRFLILGYDPNGRLTSVRDPLNRTVQYGYDANGDLTSVVDARGKTWTNHYDGTTHRLREIVDPLTNTVERTEYDAEGRAVRQFNAFNVKTLEIQYNIDNTRVITDAVGSVTTATYDPHGTVNNIQDPAGQTQKQFDANFRPSQITDPNTHPTSLTWSADGANLTQVIDAKGMTTTLAYDSLNNLTRTVDALGRTSNFTYDPGSRLLRSSTDDLGNTTLYTYTAEGFLQAQSDARGNTTHYTYNPLGQRTSVTDALNNVTRFDYDLVGRLITTTDALQHKTVNQYDNADHLTKVTQNYWAGQPQNYLTEWNIVTQYGYDDVGRRTLITDTLNHVTKNDYDPAGRLIKVTQNYDAGQPQNGGSQYNIVTQYGYDSVGRQTYITDTLGYVTRNEYDAAGRLWKTTGNYWAGQPAYYQNQYNLITTYGFDPAGNVTSKTDTLNRQTRTGYDELNRPMTVTVNYVDGVYNAAEPDRDLRTVTTYDAVGNVQTTTDPLLNVTRTDYDRLNRPSKVTVNYVDGVYNPAEPDKDLVTLQHYDSVGNRDLVTNTLEYETQTEFDALNRTYRVTQNPLGGQPQNYQNEWNILTQYGYNELGSRVTTTDTAGRVTKNDYDALNRLKTVTANYVQGAPADWQTNVTTSYTYDALGNRKTATDPLTHATSWDYDLLNRVLTETRPLNNVTAYAYDPQGNRIRVTDPRSHSTLYSYDALSRNTTITDTLGQVTRLTYDAAGRRTQQTDPLSHSTSYGYDLADRQTTITDTLTHVTRYGYDGLGNRVKVTDARNVITAYWYDGANRLQGVIENYVQGGGSDQQTNVTTEYAYDGLGNRTLIHDAKAHDTNFTYDRLNRVQTEADALSHTTTYHYYPTGQRSLVVDAKNQQTLYTYDNLYRLKQTIYSTEGTSEQFQYDAVGNRKVMTDTVGVTRYSYDDLNRLRQVIDPYNQTVGYDYDAAGNRTLITYPDTKTVNYTYTALNRLESVKDWANQWTYYGYDAASRPLTATLPNGVTTSYAFDQANRLTGLSHTTGGGSVTLGDYQFGLDAMGNRTAITETVQVPGMGAARRVVIPTQILLPFLSNQAAPAQPTIQSSQYPILLPFVSNGSVGPSEWRPILPLDPLRREPARAPTAAATPPHKAAVPTVALPTPNKTAVPQTAPGQTRVPTRALPAPTATPTDPRRVGERRPPAVESVTASAPMTTTFTPVADAYVHASNPTTNYGTDLELKVDGSPEKRAYLRFNVAGVSEGVTRATLKLYANTSLNAGITAKQVADTSWGETTITYNNAPAVGTAITSTGAIAAGTWVSLDVTSYVTGNGTYSLGLANTSGAGGVALASREAGAHAPQLIVETAPSGTFAPVADAHVNANNPTTNYGTDLELKVDGSPDKRAYLRFPVQGVTGTIRRATLQLYANNALSAGITAHRVTDNSWGETTITYNNAPPVGSALVSTGAIAAGTWVSLDVTSYVTGNGTYSLALTSTSGTGLSLSLASREAAANGPQLVLETGTPTVETTAISYSYDPLSRVTGASYSGGLTNSYGYAYDAVGNRTVQTQTITSTLVTTYGYDIANRLTTVNGVTYSWDDNGNLLSDGAKSYGYDQANRLKQVTQGAITTTFAYNGVGDRLQQTVGAATTHYVLDPAAGLTQVLADGTNTYLYGNDRLAQYQTAMQYFGADGLGSVRQIFDASAQVVGSSRYDPFGNVMSQGGTATSVFAFAGEQQDATGLTYLRARYYSAAQGRFTTRDVWEGDPSSPMSYNAWNYTSGNPVNVTDPSGMDGGFCEMVLALTGVWLPGCGTPPPTATPGITPLPTGMPTLPSTPTLTCTPTQPAVTPTKTIVPVPYATAADVEEVAKAVIPEAGMPYDKRKAPMADNGVIVWSALWGGLNNYRRPLEALSWVMRNRVDVQLNSRVPQFSGCETFSGCARSADWQARRAKGGLAGYRPDHELLAVIEQAVNGVVPDPTLGSTFFHSFAQARGPRYQLRVSNLDQVDPRVEVRIGKVNEAGFYFYTTEQWNLRLGTPVPSPTR